jgi:dihydrofolate reductase
MSADPGNRLCELTIARVRVHTAISLDGFVAGPNHEMDWIFETGGGPSPTADRVIQTTGSILMGRGAYDVGRSSTRKETSEAFGGRWSGPQFVLTHRPPDDEPDPTISFLTTDIASAVATAREAAGGKDVLVLGATVARAALEAGLVDELLLHVVPVLLGDGIALFQAGRPGRHVELLESVVEGGVVVLRYGTGGA